MVIFIFCKCVFVLLIMEVIYCQESPCPSIFQYKNESNHFYGRIEVPYPADIQNSSIVLGVQLSIANFQFANQSFNNDNIKFLGSVNDLILQQPLVFRLDFPQRNNILPNITVISVNKIFVCSGAPIQGDRAHRSTASKVNLWNIINTKFFNSTHNNPPIEEATNSSLKCYHPKFININNKNYSLTNNNHNKNNVHQEDRASKSTIDFDVNNQTIINVTTLVDIQNENISDVYNCGLSTVSIDQDSEIQKETYPWMGALYRRELSPKLLCGASLITPKVALAAGHCVTPYLDYELYLTFGRINLLDWFDTDAQTTKVQNVKFPPEYHRNIADADLAILIFLTELSITPYVQPICLSSLKRIDKEKGIVVDWNKNESIEITQHLGQSYAVTAGVDQCLLSSIRITTNRTICAEIANNISGFCNTHYEGAFYVLLNGRWTIRGIVSHSLLTTNETCGLSQYVGLLDVTEYIDWINKFL